ncbi:hypothetical protein OIU34_13980 [Pararhizobium sp. BT-229]|uniref:hypothetical protein n=1 Tax=Pararhizobium sp. BT-229 TaxID=2986923 RepID=UPI0021F7116F|nr:hypothetical protein [Pararhizobium sp. BT-229]MCV9963013.1 hypothetical protein [Pararhizobium sp. BT-229]
MFVPLHFLRMAVISIAVLAAVIVYDHAVLGWSYAAEAAPRLVAYDILRSLVALLLSAGLIHAIWQDGVRLGSPIVPRLSPKAMLAGAGVTVLAVVSGWLFSRNPQLFNALSLEDGPIEWLSALCLFAASLLFALLSVGQFTDARTGGGRQAWIACLAAAFFAFIFFVIGMEEISWMQRVFHVATPDALAELNDQKEFNFHNISTGASELLYYCGAFALLVLFPFAGLFLRRQLGKGPLSAFMPSLFVLVASAPMVAFNCGRWGVLPMQMSMMMTVIILLVLANSALQNGLWQEFLLFAGVAIAIVSVQELFLVESARLLRLWDPTEYKELFIAAGLALYAGQVWWKLRAPQRVMSTALA